MTLMMKLINSQLQALSDNIQLNLQERDIDLKSNLPYILTIITLIGDKKLNIKDTQNPLIAVIVTE